MIKEPTSESILVQNGAGFTYYKRHASSLDVKLLLTVFGSLALFSLIIAAGFAAAGAWLVMPFAGLEVAALTAVFFVMLQRAGDFEQVAVAGDRIHIEIRERGAVQRFEFHCGWTRLVTAQAGTVTLRSHGREVVIGRYSGEESRGMLAQALRCRLAGGRN